jgi:ABC transporter substrate binding protein
VPACRPGAAGEQAAERRVHLLEPSVDGLDRPGFTERLRELGWTEGRDVAIEYHWSEGRPERIAEIAAELVQKKVHVIVTYGAAVATLKQATTSIPIVLIAYDPVGSGFVASLSRPGGNVTGLSLQAPERAGKRLELLRQLVPSLRRLAILFDATYLATVLEKDNVQTVAGHLGLEVEPFETRRAEDIAPAFDALKGHTDALYVAGNSANVARIASLALNLRLPTTFEFAVPVRAGGKSAASSSMLLAAVTSVSTRRSTSETRADAGQLNSLLLSVWLASHPAPRRALRASFPRELLKKPRCEVVSFKSVAVQLNLVTCTP